MTTSTDFITISVRFFQQVLTLPIVVHFLFCDLHERKWLNDRLISVEKEEKFSQLSIWPHVFFGTSPVASTKNMTF